MDNELKCMGIQCNTVDGEWTGVSLERYKRIIKLITEDYRYTLEDSYAKRSSGIAQLVGYATPLMLRLLWEKSNSKQCILDFFEEFENSIGEKIISDAHSDLRVIGSKAHTSWINDQFHSNDLSIEAVRAAALEFLYQLSPSYPSPSSSTQLGFGQSLELIVASLAHERSFKPAIRLGRYRIGDGPAKPDCVEVCVREMVEALIFGKSIINVYLFN